MARDGIACLSAGLLPLGFFFFFFANFEIENVAKKFQNMKQTW
jgi:hypothetical protein